MLVISSMFEQERFGADNSAVIPGNTKVSVSYGNDRYDWKAIEKQFDEITTMITSSDEVLDGWPERVAFRTPCDFDAI